MDFKMISNLCTIHGIYKIVLCNFLLRTNTPGSTQSQRTPGYFNINTGSISRVDLTYAIELLQPLYGNAEYRFYNAKVSDKNCNKNEICIIAFKYLTLSLYVRAVSYG